MSAPDETEACVVLTSCAGEDEGRRIASGLVNEGLAACIQMMPIRSVYRWQGETRDEPEVLLLIKARRADWERLRDAIRAAHSYDTPEIVRLDIAAGDPAYLAWIARGGG